jgi:MFS family permease
MGILCIGLAVGPSIASLVLGQTASKDYTPLYRIFFISAFSYAICLFFILFVVPESLHPADKPSNEQISALEHSSENPTNSSALLALLRRLISPVAALRPRRVGALHKDYTLTIIAVSYFIYLMSLALYPLKYLYAEHGQPVFTDSDRSLTFF